MAVPIARAKADPRFETVVVSTGQHREMMQPILDFFEITPDFDFHLMKPGQSLTEFVGNAMIALQNLWAADRPDIVCIQGDTATCTAGALAAFFSKIPLAHIEAGLRTGDLSSPFPEEYNRRLVSLSARWNFAPTEKAKQALLHEHTDETSIFLTGNTGIDSLLAVKEKLQQDPRSSEKFRDLIPEAAKALDSKKQVILLTTHRRESFGSPMHETLSAIKELSQRPDIHIIFPVHKNPAVMATVNEVLGNAPLDNMTLIEPLDYVPFVWLMNQATIILTDSGGIQEEAPSLKKPVLVLREKTERPEAVAAGTAILVGTSRTQILKEANRLLDSPALREQMTSIQNPFGDGNATQRILDELAKT